MTGHQDTSVSDADEPQAQDLASRRAKWRAYQRARGRAMGLGLTLASLVAGAVLFVSLELLAWPAWLAWPLAVLAFLVALVVTVLLATPDQPAWPPRRPEYDAPPGPIGRWSRTVYELSDKPWRDMQAKRLERRRGSTQPALDLLPAASRCTARQLIVLVAAVLGLLLIVGAAVASVSSLRRRREERRQDLERFERELPPELREQWEEHKGSGG